MNLNKSFSLFELILVLFISSIILIFSLKYTQELNKNQEDEKELLVLKTDLLSTKIIIEKNLPDILNKLKYKNNTLFIDNNIFLKDVTNFEIKKQNNKVDIELTLKNKINQKWEFYYENK